MEEFDVLESNYVYDVVEEIEVVQENEIVEEYTTTQTIPAVAASTGTGTAAATREVN